MPWWGWALIGVGVWVVVNAVVLLWFHAVSIGDQKHDEEAEHMLRLARR